MNANEFEVNKLLVLKASCVFYKLRVFNERKIIFNFMTVLYIA